MLLADLHIHTTWSDGRLWIEEVIDLFGRSGHDVIGITDHIVNSDNVVGKVTHRFGWTLTAENFGAYRAAVEAAARRGGDAEGTVEEMLVRANDAGVVVVACHPHEQSEWFANTFYLWDRRHEVSNAVHLWVLACA